MKKIMLTCLGILVVKSILFAQTITFAPPVTLGNPGVNSPNNFECKSTFALQLDDGVTSTSGADATAVWCNSETINLEQSFETRFNIRFNDVDQADGITFTMQREGLGALEGGGGYLGVSSDWVSGIDPSVNVEFDIFDNGTTNADIAANNLENHVAISYDGNLRNPVTLASSITLTSATWHSVQVNWDACSNQLTVRMDGNIIAELNDDLTNNVFDGDPTGVIFGFTSATHNENTTHDLCFVSHRTSFCTCEEIIEPTFDFFSPAVCGPNDCCIGATLNLNSSVPSSVVWDWGDGTTSYTNIHRYATGGIYTVRAIVQYQLVGSPLECCTKVVEQVVKMNCRRRDELSDIKNKAEVINAPKAIKLFPNPVQKGTILTIELPDNIEGSSFSMFNVSGIKVMDLNEKEGTSLRVKIPKDMENGMYFIKSNNENIEATKFYIAD